MLSIERGTKMVATDHALPPMLGSNFKHQSIQFRGSNMNDYWKKNLIIDYHWCSVLPAY